MPHRPRSRVPDLITPVPTPTFTSSSLAVPPLSTFGNVIAPPSGGAIAFDQEKLRILTTASTPTSQRIAALNVLAEQLLREKPGALGYNVKLPLFDTTAHCQIFEALYEQVLGLSLGAYVGINGKPCRLLSGARGIGKTTMLRALMAVLSAAFPEVIFLYVTGTGLDSRRSSFATMDLLSLMLAASKDQRSAPSLYGISCSSQPSSYNRFASWASVDCSRYSISSASSISSRSARLYFFESLS